MQRTGATGGRSIYVPIYVRTAYKPPTNRTLEECEFDSSNVLPFPTYLFKGAGGWRHRTSPSCIRFLEDMNVAVCLQIMPGFQGT